MHVKLPNAHVVTLSASDFVGRGGQGTIYGLNQTAYKIFHQQSATLPRAKFSELARICSPYVLSPTAILTDEQDQPIGYAMPLVTHTVPVCRLFPRVFREANQISPATLVQLVKHMRLVLDEIHRSGCVVVDLNELNVLVAPDYQTAYFIDTDSYKTPSFGATAVMDTIRDRLATDGDFNKGTDWFSFAVITFQLFTGIHPYRGFHGTYKTLESRMGNQVSVFDPSVKLPPTADDFGVIPSSLRQWYEAVFQRSHRGPPPRDFGSVDQIDLRQISDTAALSFDVESVFEEPIRLCRRGHGQVVVVTESWIYIDGVRRGATPPGRIEVMFSPRRHIPTVVGWTMDQGLTVWDTERLTTVAFGIRADALMSAANGDIYFRSGPNLMALSLMDTSGGVIMGAHPVAQLHRYATQAFRGVLVQRLLGTTYFTCLHDGGATHRRVPELDGYLIVEAVFDRTVLMVLGIRDGRYSRFVIRFAQKNQTNYSVTPFDDVAGAAGDMVVLSGGVMVLKDEDGALQLLSTSPKSTRIKRVSAEEVGCFDLVHRGHGLGFVRGTETGTVRMK
jgi:hypothetical protein